MRLAAALNHIFKNLGSDLHSDVALPVTSVEERFRSCMPTGRFICPISPARKGNWKKKEIEKKRNEGRTAADAQVQMNKRQISFTRTGYLHCDDVIVVVAPSG